MADNAIQSSPLVVESGLQVTKGWAVIAGDNHGQIWAGTFYHEDNGKLHPIWTEIPGLAATFSSAEDALRLFNSALGRYAGFAKMKYRPMAIRFEDL